MLITLWKEVVELDNCMQNATIETARSFNNTSPFGSFYEKIHDFILQLN